MACYRLCKAFLRLPDSRGKTGRPVFISRGSDFPVGLSDDRKLLLPCGKCVGCRFDTSRSLAVRCAHETTLYDDGLNNSFVTLTYDDKHLPHNGSLVKKDVQDFLKRLRYFRPDNVIRYFYCGEYGTDNMRPHYHLILFNTDFPDKVLWRVIGDSRLYISQELFDIWGKGFVTIGHVTFQSAAYVARYVTKKIHQDDSNYPPYSFVDFNGEIQHVIGEYQNMSKSNGGLGYGWYSQYKHDIYNRGFIVLDNDFKCKIPTYYDRCYEKEHPELFAVVKAQRKEKAQEMSLSPDNQLERLIVRERHKLLSVQKFIREL